MRSNDVLAIFLVIMFIVAIWAVIPEQERTDDLKLQIRIKEKLALERPDIIDELYKQHIEDFFKEENVINAKIAISYIESYIKENGFSESAYSDIAMLWSYMKQSDRAIDYLFTLYKKTSEKRYLNRLIDNILWSSDPLKNRDVLMKIIPEIDDPLVFQRIESILDNDDELDLLATYRYCELFPEEALSVAERFIEDSRFDEVEKIIHVLNPYEKRYIKRKIAFKEAEYQNVIRSFENDKAFNKEDISNYLLSLYYPGDYKRFIEKASLFIKEVESKELLYNILDISLLMDSKLFFKVAEKIMDSFPENRNEMQYLIYQYYYRKGQKEKALISLKDSNASPEDIFNVLLNLDMNKIQKDILLKALTSIDTKQLYLLILEHREITKIFDISEFELSGKFKGEVLYLYGKRLEAAETFTKQSEYLRAFDIYMQLDMKKQAADILIKGRDMFNSDQVDMLLTQTDDGMFIKLFNKLENKGFYSYDRMISLSREKDPETYQRILKEIKNKKEDKRFRLLYLRQQQKFSEVSELAKEYIDKILKEDNKENNETDYYIDSLFTAYLNLRRYRDFMIDIQKYADIINKDTALYFRFSYSLAIKNFKDALFYLRKSDISLHYYDQMMVYIENNMPDEAYEIVREKYLQEKNKRYLREYWGYFYSRESGLSFDIPSRQNGINKISLSHKDFYKGILLDLVNLSGDDSLLSSFSRDILVMTLKEKEFEYSISKMNDRIRFGASFIYHFEKGEIEVYFGDILNNSNLIAAAFRRKNGIRYLRELKVDEDEFSSLSLSFDDIESFGNRISLSAYYEKRKREDIFRYLSIDMNKVNYNVVEIPFYDISTLNGNALRSFIEDSMLDESMVISCGIRREDYFEDGFFKLSMGLYYDILNNIGGPSINIDYLRRNRFFINLSGGYSNEGEKVIDIQVGKRYE